MGRRSKFDRLPEEIVAAVNRRIREGATIAEVCELLAQKGEPTPPSTVGRYMKDAREQIAKARQARDVAGQWVAELGENPTGDVGVLLAEMLKTVAYSHIDQMLGPGEEGAPKKPHKAMDLMLLAKMIRDLEATAKASLDRTVAAKRATLESAVEKAGEVGQRAGLSQTTIDEIQRELRLL